MENSTFVKGENVIQKLRCNENSQVTYPVAVFLLIAGRTAQADG